MWLTFHQVLVSLLHLIATKRNNHKLKVRHSPFHTWHPYPTGSLLNPNIFVFRPIANKTILTTPCFHDVFAKFFTLSPKHCPNTFFYLSLVTESRQMHFKSPIGHQGTWLIIISHLLIIIPGICIASHASVTSRSLTTLPKPCSILLKNILY